MIASGTESEQFFAGEFALALTNIDSALAADRADDVKVPLPGLYLYLSEASEAIAALITERSEMLERLYSAPLDQILRLFEQNAHLAAAPECWSRGVMWLKPTQIYQDALARRSRRSPPK
jgi:hypothetical protein